MTSKPQSSFSVSVHDLVHRPGEQRTVDLAVEVPETWGSGLATVPAGETIDIGLRLESVHEGILVTGDVSAEAEAECARCLKALALPLDVVFQELFAYPGQEGFDYAVHDDHVDLESVVRDEVVLALPFQPVCPDGCQPEAGDGVSIYLSGDVPPERSNSPWAALGSLVEQQGRDGGEAQNQESK